MEEKNKMPQNAKCQGKKEKSIYDDINLLLPRHAHAEADVKVITVADHHLAELRARPGDPPRLATDLRLCLGLFEEFAAEADFQRAQVFRECWSDLRELLSALSEK